MPKCVVVLLVDAQLPSTADVQLFCDAASSQLIYDIFSRRVEAWDVATQDQEDRRPLRTRFYGDLPGLLLLHYYYNCIDG